MLGKYYIDRLFFVVFLSLLLTACGGSNFAPIIKSNYYQANPGRYRVQKGDTLYSIAFAFGLDYRDIAKANGINPPYALKIGQILNVNPKRRWRPTQIHKVKVQTKRWSTPKTKARKIQALRPSKHYPSTPRYLGTVKRWNWPAKGKIIQAFAPWKGSKGINIAGANGSPIYASAAGIVVYAGHGLNAYGNLIIIKHNNRFLSAYAHNRVLLVKEGQYVRARQKIALMGKTGASRTMLHFEIRINGKPVNPLKYLPRY